MLWVNTPKKGLIPFAFNNAVYDLVDNQRLLRKKAGV